MNNNDQHKMVIALATGGDEEEWKSLLLEHLPNSEVTIWPDWRLRNDIDYIIAWKLPQGALNKCKCIKAVFSIGAGVDQLIKDDEFPQNVPVIRMIDENLGIGMAEYVTLAVLSIHRDLITYVNDQQVRTWNPLPQQLALNRSVGLMGFGELGKAVHEKLKNFGFNFCIWSRTKKDICGVKEFIGESQLDLFLNQTDILVVLLPLTHHTKGILNRTSISKLPKGSSIINVARGPILDVDGAKEHLDSGHLSLLWLDVVDEEPLPRDHWMWGNKNVVITPHIAAATIPQTGIRRIVDSISIIEKEGICNVDTIDVQKGY